MKTITTAKYEYDKMALSCSKQMAEHSYAIATNQHHHLEFLFKHPTFPQLMQVRSDPQHRLTFLRVSKTVIIRRQYAQRRINVIAVVVIVIVIIITTNRNTISHQINSR